MPSNPSAGHRERLRQRFLNGESQALTEEALLELLLSYAIPQKDVRPLARALLSRFGSLASVLGADIDSLRQVKGIAVNTAALIKLVHYFQLNRSADGDTQAPEAPVQIQLFGPPIPIPPAGNGTSDGSASAQRPAPAPYRLLPRRGGELFSQSVLDEAIRLLPQLPKTESLDEVAEFLQRRMRFNSQQTRRRYVSYITRRMFPAGRADAALHEFARAFAGRQELRDVCYYRFCRAEPLMFRVTDELLLPAIQQRGGLERRQLRQYLAQRFPGAGNIGHCAKAIVEALTDAGLARATRTQIAFVYREPLPVSLAFVLHSEFPPGIYDLAELEGHQALRALLWNPDRLLPQLYELRNWGWIAKVSEIDSVRQFTVRWTLDELVAALTAEGEGRDRG